VKPLGVTTDPKPANPRPASEEPRVLGANPFAEPAGRDPFVAALEAVGYSPLPATGRPARPQPVPRRPKAREARPAAEPTPLLRPRWASTPSLAEIELPEAAGFLERFLGEEDRRRLAALEALAEGEGDYDRFGLSPAVVRRSFPFFYALYKAWFRVESSGAEILPATGPAILAANHGGLLPFDGAMLVIDVLRNTDPPRLLRSIVELWAGTLPWVNVFYARVGQVIGTRENFTDLLDDGQLVLVFPEGIDGVRKTIDQRHRIQPFHVGFVEQALLCRAPIIPVAVVGSDDQTPILYDIKPLARWLGLPAAPITPTFPLLGPLGLLPYPVKYRVVYGQPLAFHEIYGPEDAGDARLVHDLAGRVRAELQHLVERQP
jgi:1-acyl-sn-glycerol-3-phosphate acyltransferase